MSRKFYQSFSIGCLLTIPKAHRDLVGRITVGAGWRECALLCGPAVILVGFFNVEIFNLVRGATNYTQKLIWTKNV